MHLTIKHLENGDIITEKIENVKSIIETELSKETTVLSITSVVSPKELRTKFLNRDKVVWIAIEANILYKSSCKHCGKSLGTNEEAEQHAGECPVMCGD